MREETISINGVLYDAKTGLPVNSSTSTKPVSKKVTVRQPKKIPVNSAPKTTLKPIKRKTTPSKTLNRQIVKKPISNRTAPKLAKPVQKPITKPQPKPVATSSQRPTPTRIMQRGTKRPKPIPQKNTSTPKNAKLEDKKSKLIPVIITVCAIAAIAGVVLAYFFVPSFSVWVAGQRAEVNAVLPTYTPPGYRVAGTADSSLGLVTINYHSDAQGNNYSLTQANSNWDSNGVLENKVKPLGGSHQTLSQKGLTIFRYPSGAIWVNGRILYTITDEGKLSNEQILQIVDGI